MSSRLYALGRLAFNSTLDFATGYTIAAINDSFFNSSWFNTMSMHSNLDEGPVLGMFSLIMRLWLQLMMTALVGSEARALLLPEDQMDGFSTILFIFGLIQQPHFIERLKLLQDQVVRSVNGGSGSNLPLNSPEPLV